MPRIVRRRKVPGKGRRRGGRRNLRLRRNRKVRNVSEYASLSEVRVLTPGSGGFATNNMYSLMNTTLNQFSRAAQVAAAYQHYRIKHIALKVKPTFDTFVTTNDPANVNTKHFLYYMIDKAGALPTNITLAGLKAMGARPHALDETTRVAGWRPSVLTVDMTAGGGAPLSQPAQYKISPWLNTNANSVNPGIWAPSSVDHLGIYWYVEQLAGAEQPYTVECEVQFEFKKPLLATAVGQTHAIQSSFAQYNASKDGIVDDRPGGDDTLLVS